MGEVVTWCHMHEAVTTYVDVVARSVVMAVPLPSPLSLLWLSHYPPSPLV